MSEHIEQLQRVFARSGLNLTHDEISHILRLLSDVTLKLIITNVPKSVYHYPVATDTFENLFRSFDDASTFVYLPSFSRVLVYLRRPEAALCARLQTQGWKLPDDVINQLPPDFSVGNDGICCYIDHVDVIEEEEEDANTVSADQDFCCCGRQVDAKHPVTEETVPFSSFSHFAENGARFDRPMDNENTSEASGDDLAVSLSPLCPTCHRPKRKMKFLAPPKLKRQFFLSPPASPPVGWEPAPEHEPVINYSLLEALAAMAPGEAFELHPGSGKDSHPSIVLTPCEPSGSNDSRLPIVQTRCPERRF